MAESRCETHKERTGRTRLQTHQHTNGHFASAHSEHMRLSTRATGAAALLKDVAGLCTSPPVLLRLMATTTRC